MIARTRRLTLAEARTAYRKAHATELRIVSALNERSTPKQVARAWEAAGVTNAARARLTVLAGSTERDS